MMNTAIHYGMSNDEYHADPAIGSTSVKAMSVSPANLYFNPFTGGKSAHTGSAIHAALLEPDYFSKEYVCREDIKTRNSREYKEMALQTKPENILIGSEVETIKRMSEASRLNEEFMHYMRTKGNSEISMFAECPETGLRLKCRFDRLSETIPYPLDVKSCRDATKHAFSRDFGKYRYHIQAAFYLYVLKLATGIDLNQFAFFAIQNAPPYQNSMYYIGEESLELGRKQMFLSLNKIKACMGNEKLKFEGIVLPSDEINVPDYLFDDEFEEEVYI